MKSQNKLKILFLIPDLGGGGAEKVLVNLVNHMDQEKFDITILTLFGDGVNVQFLKPWIKYRALFKKTFRGNSKIMKLFTPEMLHHWFIKETYDVEVAYLEGPAARIISGCPHRETKLVSWIHIEQHTKKKSAASFRSYNESVKCYGRFHRIICVAETVKLDFCSLYQLETPISVLYNTNESDIIRMLSREDVPSEIFHANEIKLIGVGKVIPKKGFDRVARICKRLNDEGFPVHVYVLGIGSQQNQIQKYIDDNSLSNKFTFLGYQTNPYKYVSKADLFVCASHAEGFSTAATEALIVGTPVVTTQVSGMKEMLGENDEYGIVTENDEEALYRGIRRLLDDPSLLAHYRKQAQIRSKTFSTENTVQAVEKMLLSL